jgi:hypothetical protein
MPRRTFSSAEPAHAEQLAEARDKALQLSAGCAAWLSGPWSRLSFACPNEPAVVEAVRDEVFERTFREQRILQLCSPGDALQAAGGSSGAAPAPADEPRLANLIALETASDGNCLLHSLSLAISGAHDRLGTLRRALADSMAGASGAVFRQRWQPCKEAAYRALGFRLEPAQWDEEWATLVRRAGAPGASLEDIHVFVLAHVLPLLPLSSHTCCPSSLCPRTLAAPPPFPPQPARAPAAALPCRCPYRAALLRGPSRAPCPACSRLPRAGPVHECIHVCSDRCH